MAIVYLLLISSSCLLQWSGAFTPVVYDAKVLLSSQCDQSDPFEDNDQQLMEALKMAQQQLPSPECNPPTTCSNVLHCNSSATSDYYQILDAYGSIVQVYCDMEGTNCEGEGGWMRVAYFNVTDPSMTDPYRQCPVDYKLLQRNFANLCARNTTTTIGCGSMLLETFGVGYSKVCGYARGYQLRKPDAFQRSSNVPLSGNYVDGVSITYGTPPTHIWTYAAGNAEEGSPSDSCPCNTDPGPSPPSYVGSDYYCEAGRQTPIWRVTDPLWDGANCGGDEGPCCNHTGWFIKNTPIPTAASINVRVCVDEANEDVGLEQLQLYVK